MSTKKILSMILALALSSSALYGCTNNTDSSSEAETSSGEMPEAENNDTSDSESENSSEAEEEPDYSVSELADGIMMNISGHEISDDEYKYFFMYAKYYLDKGDDSYWDDDESGDKLKSLKEQTMDFLVSNSAVYKIASDKSIELDEEDQTRIDKKVEEAKAYYTAQNGGQDFDEYLKETYCTPEVFRNSYISTYLEKKIINEIYGKDYREKYFNDYVAVKFIQLKTSVVTEENFKTYIEIDETLSYTEEEKAAVQKINDIAAKKDEAALKEAIPELIEVIRNRAAEGESFDSLMKKYNMDTSSELKDNDEFAEQYVNQESMQPEFLNAANSLEENEISDGSLYIEGSGFFIIQRKPFDEEYLSEYLIPLFMGDSEYSYANDYMDLSQSALTSMEVTVDTDYEKVSIDYFK